MVHNALTKGLIFLLISAFFFACKDNEGIEPVVKNSELSIHLKSDFSIATSTVVLDDNIDSENPSALLAGHYVDPITGTTSATAYFDLTPGNEGRNFGSNPKCETLQLTIPFSTINLGKTTSNGVIDAEPAVVGDTTEGSSLVLELYRVEETIISDGDYTTKSVLTLSEEPISENDGSLNPVSTDLVFNIDPSLGDEILTETSTVSNEEFRSQLKGFAIKAKDGTTGAIFGLAFKSSNAYLKMVYSIDGTSGYEEYMYAGNASYNQIESDRSSSSLAVLSENLDEISSEDLNNTTVIHSGSGLVTKVLLTDIGNFVGANSEVNLNKAELIMPVPQDSYDGSLDHPIFKIRLAKLDESGELIYDEDDNIEFIDNYDAVASGSFFNLNSFDYIVNNGYYVCNITSYIQSLIQGTETHNGLAVMSYYNNSSVYQTVLSDPSDAENGLRLKVYYSDRN